MCGIPQSSRVIVTLCASCDQRARSVREGDGDCAAAVETSAAQRRTSLLKDLVISDGWPRRLAWYGDGPLYVQIDDAACAARALHRCSSTPTVSSQPIV